MTKIPDSTIKLTHSDVQLQNDFIAIGRVNSDQSISINLYELAQVIGDRSYIINGNTKFEVFPGTSGYAELLVNSISRVKLEKDSLTPSSNDAYSLGTVLKKIKDLHLSGAIQLGADDIGDIYYRDAAGKFNRLPIGTNDQILKIYEGLPSWADEIDRLYNQGITNRVTSWKDSDNITNAPATVVNSVFDDYYDYCKSISAEISNIDDVVTIYAMLSETFINSGIFILGNLRILELLDYDTDAPDKGNIIWEVYGKLYKQSLTGLVADLSEYFYPAITNEPNGFIDRTQVTLSFDEPNKLVVLTGTYSFYSAGVLYTKTDESINILGTEGLQYVYYDEAGTLQVIDNASFTLDLIEKYCFVASLYWDATNLKAIPNLLSELHGYKMPASVHSYFHRVNGTVYVSGIGLTINTAGDGSLNSHAQFISSAGVIQDEDLPHNIVAKSNLTDNVVVLYKSGAAGNWRKVTTGSYPLINSGSGRASYNVYTGGSWQLVEVGNNKYVLAHLFAIPGVTPTTGSLVALVGQNEYATDNDARVGANTEMNSLNLTGLPSAEYKAIATIIILTSTAYANTPKSKFVPTGTGDYIDWRKSTPSATPSASSSVWGTITGTLSNQTDLQSALNAKENSLGNPSANDMLLVSTTGGTRSWRYSKYRVKFSQTNTVDVTNTTTETSLIGTGQGVKTFASGELSVGSNIRLILEGTYIVGASSELFTARIYLTGTKIADIAGSFVSNTGTEWGYRMEINLLVRTIGATGTCVLTGEVRIETRSTGFAQSRFVNSSTEITIDTTTTNDVDVTFQWGDAEATNSIKNIKSILELLAV